MYYKTTFKEFLENISVYLICIWPGIPSITIKNVFRQYCNVAKIVPHMI